MVRALLKPVFFGVSPVADTTTEHASGWQLARIKRHVSELVRLAGPVVVARAGFMTMALVDTLMVGRYSTQDLGYQGLGLAPSGFLIVTGFGLIMGTLVLSSKAYGAGDYQETGAVWRRSVPYAFCIGLVALVVSFFAEPFFLLTGQDPDLARGAGEVALVVGLGLPLGMVFMTSTYFLESIGRPAPGMIITVVANVVNVGINWLLIYGNMGLPELGAVGSAWATTGVRVFTCLSILLYIWHMPGWQELGVRTKPTGGWKAWAHQRTIGYASAVSTGVESLGFTAMTIFAGLISTVALASYSIALNILALVFMVALGLGTATSARVGIARGRQDHKDMALAGWTGLGVTVVCMGTMGLVAALFAEQLVSFYTTDPEVIALAASMMIFLAFAMPVDGGQATMAFALRGRGETWVPSGLHFFSYFILMVPLAWVLIFVFDRGGIAVAEAILYASIWSMFVLSLRFAWLARGDAKAGKITGLGNA